MRNSCFFDISCIKVAKKLIIMQSSYEFLYNPTPGATINSSYDQSLYGAFTEREVENLLKYNKNLVDDGKKLLNFYNYIYTKRNNRFEFNHFSRRVLRQNFDPYSYARVDALKEKALITRDTLPVHIANYDPNSTFYARNHIHNTDPVYKVVTLDELIKTIDFYDTTTVLYRSNDLQTLNKLKLIFKQTIPV
ncbi:hypothetical protein CCFV1_ORF062 [Cotesia congregata filamentous virus 1]|uniref:Uncharacterized protein n=1 Tax=Cotesia congregata filamentous virus 1 TaxID=3064291 RepID=A0ABC8QNA4_9VIRU|nr:hypothetical protein CCFV1_ORF062 [Cotesia congregata filamentous virus 1]